MDTDVRNGPTGRRDLLADWGSEALLAILVELQEYVGVVYAGPLSNSSSATLLGTADSGDRLLVQIVGLPGLGKSTLFRGIFELLRAEGRQLFAIPEAANFAVDKKGYTLDTMEKLLTPLYTRAENEAIRLAYRIPGLIALREPARVQNDVYLDVQQWIRENSKCVEHIERLAKCYCMGTWDPLAAPRLVPELKRAMVGESCWKWPGKRVFLHLTTEAAVDDISLSIARQNNPDRDPRLSTSDPVRLCGYKAALEALVSHLLTDGHGVFRIDPLAPRDEQLDIVSEFLASALA